MRRFTWLVVAAAAVAQTPPRKEPLVPTHSQSRSIRTSPPSIRSRMPRPPAVALGPLSQAEAAVLSEPSLLPRVGVHRRLPEGVRGVWEITPEGQSIWRMVVHSPGSAGIRVQFTRFSVGSGKVWLHDGARFVGPYTGEGIFGNGTFWSETVFGDTAVVEYQPADGSQVLPFRIEKIAHQVPEPSAQAAAPAFLDVQAAPDPADTCHLDPNCFPDWQTSMKSVGQIIFEEQGFTALCSGALVGTRDDNLKPYFMTAAHCVNSEEVARTVETYWTYQTSSCGGSRPSRADSTKSSPGAHLLTAGAFSTGDYSLLLLRDVPNGVVYAGWDPGEPALEAPLVGIHHPKGSYKRISFGNRVGDESVVIENKQGPAPEYYQVMWSKGRTEPGSSGSPLFSGPGMIVGTLSYGPVSNVLTTCQINPSVDGYGRFVVAYPQMRDYLEDLPAAMVLPSPAKMQVKGLNRSLSGGSQAVTLTTQSPNPVYFKARADAPWIQLSTVSGQLSAAAPFTLQVTVDPAYLSRTGTYTSTVTITSGAADPQFIDVNVDMTVQQSQVAVSFSPNPVPSQPPDIDGARWIFHLQLDEQAGTGTRIASLKINGVDYSQFIGNFFGTDHLDAKGSLAADLRASGNFAEGDQYFEFTGTDDGSNTTWYRSATVKFQ